HAITVLATSADGSTSSKSFTINVTDVNEFDVSAASDSNAAANTVAENAASGSAVGITAHATDADGSNNTVTYSLSDSAGGRFAIDASTGVVTVADGSLLDYEAATSHAITVLATSADGSTASRSFTVALTDVNDNSPVITSNGGGTAASISVPENETAVTTVVASDADLPAQTLVYSIAGGADASRFTIDGTTGVLSFAVAPDFESPADADADNVYEVVVRAGDGAGGETTQALSVAVTGVDEAPLAAPDTVTGDEDTLLSGNVLANDSDPEGQPLQAALLTGPAHGEVTLNADGSFTYRPAADWFGTDGYTYRVSVVGSTADGVVILEVRPVNDTAVVTQAHLQMEQGVPAVLDTRALDASDVDGDRMSIAFELGSISGGRIERADAPGVAVDRFTVAELVGGQLRVVPTGGALEIVLRTFDGETPGEWVSMRIDTLPAAPEAPPSEPTAPAPPAAPIAPDAGLAPPAPPPAAPPPPAPLAASPPQEADLAASTPDLAPAPVVASATTEQGAAMPSTAALAPRFAAERIALAAGTSGAASSAAAGGASSPRADAGPVQLVVDLQFEVVQQRLAAGLNAPAAARALSVGLSPPDAADAEPAMAEAANRLSANVEAVEVAGLTLTVGVIWWALRLAGVAGSLLVSLPAWGMIDPLPILGAPPDDDDDDAADSSRDPDDAVDEDAIAEVLARPANTRTAARP
ncbi:cadherin domain-containing protein, partial [Piscinibacter sp.]|uniref:cadherin domain-containing protein n=1 Tax=Piscinibacter sp. TaxID=1903157 RepID=UPI002B8979DC